jgi:hypothetical protein
METLIYLLAIFGLVFVLKEKDGPWNLFTLGRHWLFSTRFGVFFDKMFSCYFCLGFHCGWLIYLISPMPWHFGALFLWGLAGAAFCYIIGMILK